MVGGSLESAIPSGGVARAVDGMLWLPCPSPTPATRPSSSPSAAGARTPWPRRTAATRVPPSPWPVASSVTVTWPRRSSRRCSLRLWNAPERYDPERGSLRSYLLAQTHGRSVDLLRSETSRRRREEREARETAEHGVDIEREVIDLTVADQVKEVVAELPADERRAIELAYFGGHTYRQVAVLLDQPEGTVKSRIRSGLRRMRQGLVEAGVGVSWES
jgi:RNA polymerase sigma factor (sigma-70 family)